MATAKQMTMFAFDNEPISKEPIWLEDYDGGKKTVYRMDSETMGKRLLTLTLDERSALLQAGATERHVRALLRLPDTQRAPLIERLSREHWTVARTEREVEARLHPAAAPKQRVVPLVRDVRLFFNTVEKAVDTMRRSGVLADASRRETDAYFEYVVRIPKPEASLSKTGS